MLFGSVAGGGGGGSFAISGVSGTKSHGSSITISGAQFGTKSSPGSVIYDDASGTSPTSTGWSEAWPNGATGGAAYDMAYRSLPTTNGSVSTLPHSHITKAICGAHNAGVAGTGASVNVEYYRTGHSRPSYTFASFWVRFDPNWSFSSSQPNNKMYDWGPVHGGYADENWYLEYGSGGNTWTSGAHGDLDTWWHINSDNPNPPLPMQSPDANGHDWNDWDDAKSPFSNWIKVEYAIRWSTGSDGYIKVWENGVLKMNYAGSTDMSTGDWAGTNRYDMIGGYSDDRGASNWRYFCDIYYDHVLNRVVLGNASTIGACTRKEMQVCTAWSDTSITCTMKHGAIPTGSAWLYVYKADGTPTAGFAVTLV